jgi:hypothetical protein
MAKVRLSEHAWRERFRSNFQDRFLLRFHMFLITLAMLLSGVLVSKVLWTFGVRALLIRYPVAVLCSYGIFFVLIRLWLWYVSLKGGRDDSDGSSSYDELDDGLATDGVIAGAELATSGVRHTRRAYSKASNFDLGDLSDGDGEGLVLALLLLVLLALFGSSLYLIWEAPALLTEAAVQMVLATSLRRATRQIDTPDWAGSVLGKTWAPFAIVLFLTFAFATAARHYCPTATRLTEIIHGNACAFERARSDSYGPAL